MTAQEIFNKVRTHLLAQGRKASEGGTCRYRTETGEMCAVGCLIPGYLYTEEIEAIPVCELGSNNHNEILEQVLPSDMAWQDGLDFLSDLQLIHDLKKPEEWPLAFAAFAEKHSFTVEAV